MPACTTQSLTAAIAAARPIAFLVGTPEFCQTGVCGPVLDLLVEQAPDHPEIQFVHAEVYTNVEATRASRPQRSRRRSRPTG